MPSFSYQISVLGRQDLRTKALPRNEYTPRYKPDWIFFVFTPKNVDTYIYMYIYSYIASVKSDWCVFSRHTLHTETTRRFI